MTGPQEETSYNFVSTWIDVSTLQPGDRLEAFEDVLATHPNLVEYGLCPLVVKTHGG